MVNMFNKRILPTLCIGVGQHMETLFTFPEKKKNSTFILQMISFLPYYQCIDEC